MSNTPYHATYKCRLCGAKFETIMTSFNTAFKTTAKLCGDHTSFKAGDPFIYDIHKCEDGSLGFADLCGWRKYEEVE